MREVHSFSDDFPLTLLYLFIGAIALHSNQLLVSRREPLIDFGVRLHIQFFSFFIGIIDGNSKDLLRKLFLSQKGEHNEIDNTWNSISYICRFTYPSQYYFHEPRIYGLTEFIR